jgi:hypothetical protein
MSDDVTQENSTDKITTQKGINLKQVPPECLTQLYDFSTPEKTKEFMETIHPKIITSIDRERQEIFAIRNILYFGVQMQREKEYDANATVFGTSTERFMLAKYITVDDSKITREQNKEYLDAVAASVEVLIRKRHAVVQSSEQPPQAVKPQTHPSSHHGTKKTFKQKQKKRR